MRSSSLTVAAVQTAALPYDKGKLDYYLTIAKSKGAKVVLFGEYVLNLFFKELAHTSPKLIEDQTRHHYEALKNAAFVYHLTIVAPMVLKSRGGFKKSLVRFSPAMVKTHDQQLLMPYPHWNEAAFFTNRSSSLTLPLFQVDGFKIAMMMGFELHFDPLWEMARKKRVDAVLLPTASTFESAPRWREIIKTRAFLNSLYVIRVNRTGHHTYDDQTWQFYGDSLVANPFGDVEEALGNKEEVLLATIERPILTEARRAWGFDRILKNHASKE